jgi:hypothetical protein
MAGAMDTREAVVHQGIHIAVRHAPDAAAATAVAAIGAAAGDEFLAAETGDAIPALTGVDLDFDFVNEFHGCLKRKSPIGSIGLSRSRLPARSGDRWNDTHGLTLVRPLDAELNMPVHLGEQGVILPKTHVQTRMHQGSALANQDAARRNQLPSKALDAKALGFRIAAVAAATACLLVCHVSFSWSSAGNVSARGDAADLNFGVILPVAGLFLEVLAATVLEDTNLVAPAVGDDRALYRSARHYGTAHGHLITFSHHKNLIERHFGTNVRRERFNPQLVASADPVLLAARLDDRVHKHLQREVAKRRGRYRSVVFWSMRTSQRANPGPSWKSLA